MSDAAIAEPTTTTTSAGASTAAGGAGPVSPRVATALRPLAFGAARIVGGHLGALQQRNGEHSIPAGWQHMDELDAWGNFRRAAANEIGAKHSGPVFEDGEAFKWLEGVAWEQGRAPRAELIERLVEGARLAAAAQADDGYLSTFNQYSGLRGRYEWMSDDHEIFNMATMLQAAVAMHRTTGDPALLDVARKAGDHLVATFGPGRREELCGHPLVEMALVELYRETGERSYLDLATWFVDFRGHETIHDYTHQRWPSTYYSDRIPIRDTVYPEGHAVRAVYFAGGATDVAIENGDTALLDHLETLWQNMVGASMYVNGSLGARWEGEAFGDPYELPVDRGYGETCAAIASTQWSWRLLLATGRARYADLMERQLWNAVLSGVAADGDAYFYVNGLAVREHVVITDDRMPAAGRQAWFGCSCCPTNLMRTLAVQHAYLATETDAGLQLHQFADAEIAAGGFRLRMRTEYPWSGSIDVEVIEAPAGDAELSIRIPGWADGAELTAAGDAVTAVAGEYAAVRRTWAAGDRLHLELPFAPRIERAHPRVESARGAVAVFRGPILYALEQVDQEATADGPAAVVDDIELDGFAPEVTPSELFGGVPTLHLPATDGPHGRAIDAVAVPYFLWANREVGPMKVWMPLPDQG